MLRKSLTVLAALFCCTAFAAGDIVVGTAPESGMAQADVYVHCDARRWQLLWDYVDEANYSGVEIVCEPRGNDVYSRQARLTMFSVVNGRKNRKSSADVTYSNDCMAVALAHKSDGFSRLVAGDKSVMASDTTFYKGIPESRVIFRPASGYRQLRHTAEIIGYVPLMRCKFATESDLRSYLKCSTDSIEGLWEYLDRNMPESRVLPGGKYTLATVRDEDTGDYSIVYVSGADIGADVWVPLSVKGTLKPTIFPDNFDLVWTDAYRTAVYDEDTSATFSVDNTVLSLSFPIFGASLRFRRVPL